MSKVSQSGDTLVEVLLAFSVFALVSVATITIMNRGTAIAQRTVEQTQVRYEINSQADLLRYARDQGGPVWASIKSRVVSGNALTTTQKLTDNGCPTSSSNVGLNAFYINMTSGGTIQYNLLSSTNYSPAQVAGDIQYGSPSKAYGMWVQVTESQGNGSSNSYDMHIRACWDTTGLNVPLVMGTTVRLYDV